MKKDKELEEMLKQIDREEEDRAWAEKKKIYGDRFNAKKFYELDRFWPNFWAWFWILIWCIPTGFILWKSYKQAVSHS